MNIVTQLVAGVRPKWDPVCPVLLGVSLLSAGTAWRIPTMSFSEASDNTPSVNSVNSTLNDFLSLLTIALLFSVVLEEWFLHRFRTLMERGTMYRDVVPLYCPDDSSENPLATLETLTTQILSNVVERVLRCIRWWYVIEGELSVSFQHTGTYVSATAKRTMMHKDLRHVSQCPWQSCAYIVEDSLAIVPVQSFVMCVPCLNGDQIKRTSRTPRSGCAHRTSSNFASCFVPHRIPARCIPHVGPTVFWYSHARHVVAAVTLTDAEAFSQWYEWLCKMETIQTGGQGVVLSWSLWVTFQNNNTISSKMIFVADQKKKARNIGKLMRDYFLNWLEP